MPFVEILWKSDQVSRDNVVRLRDGARVIIARRFTEVDPEHVVTPAMVDVRVSRVGELDLIGPDLFVTILARTEDARMRGRDDLIGRITADIEALGSPPATMVELVLTNRASVYRY